MKVASASRQLFPCWPSVKPLTSTQNLLPFSRCVTKFRTQLMLSHCFHFSMKAICSHSCACLVACKALFFPGLSPITCSGVPTCQCSFHNRLFNSTFFKGCASSQTSSVTCAPPLHGRGLVILFNIPALPSALHRSFSTHALCCSNLSVFLLFFLLCQPSVSFFQKRFAHIALPSLLASLCQLLSDIPCQTFAAATYRIHFPHHIFLSIEHFFLCLKALKRLAHLLQHCSPICFHYSRLTPPATCFQSALVISHCGSDRVLRMPLVSCLVDVSRPALRWVCRVTLILPCWRESSAPDNGLPFGRTLTSMSGRASAKLGE